MYEVLKKDYEIDLLGQTLKYEQCSLYECIDFAYLIKQKDFKLEDWIFNFLKSKISLNKIDLLKLDLSKFMEVLFDTAFKGYFSTKKGGGRSYPFEAYIMFLSEKFNIDPDTLLKKYTPEQINFYMDGIIYNLNESTKEGQRRNKMDQAMKELQKEETTEESLNKIKEMENKLKLKNN